MTRAFVAAAEAAPGGPQAAGLVLGLLVLLLAAGSVRVVPEHSRLVVQRLGRLSRVAGPGVVLRIPGLDRVTEVSLRPTHLDLVVPALTRDGVPVRLHATALTRVSDPALATGSPDPATVVAAELEAQLSGAVARCSLAELLPSRACLVEDLPGQASALTATWGVEVLTVTIVDVEARLTADLVQGLADRDLAGPP